MNKQAGPNRISWTEIFGEGTGFTSNPVGGCKHRCQWFMPNGEKAICYAKDVAEGVARAAYPDGFEAHYWRPLQMEQWKKRQQRAGIFLDSMSDLMGHWVPREQIDRVLNTARACPQHIFFLLTKNAPRLLDFDFPANVWTGVSSPPDYMNGGRMSPMQQRVMLRKSLEVLNETKARIPWMSFEPLSWDVSRIVSESPRNSLRWAVIGAASNGKAHYPPEEAHVRALIDVLDERGVKVFFKGNLRSLPWAAANWREEWPSAD